MDGMGYGIPFLDKAVWTFHRDLWIQLSAADGESSLVSFGTCISPEYNDVLVEYQDMARDRLTKDFGLSAIYPTRKVLPVIHWNSTR